MSYYHSAHQFKFMRVYVFGDNSCQSRAEDLNRYRTSTRRPPISIYVSSWKGKRRRDEIETSGTKTRRWIWTDEGERWRRRAAEKKNNYKLWIEYILCLTNITKYTRNVRTYGNNGSADILVYNNWCWPLRCAYIWWIYDSIVCQSLFFKYFTFSRSRRIYERELNFLSAVSHFSLGKRVCCVRSPYTSISIQHRAYASISMLCVPFRKEKKILFGFNYSNYNIYLAMWSARRIHITHTHTVDPVTSYTNGELFCSHVLRCD